MTVAVALYGFTSDNPPENVRNHAPCFFVIAQVARGNKRGIAVRTFNYKPAGDWLSNGGPGAIRTPDPFVRSEVLYPTELRALWGDKFILLQKRKNESVWQAGRNQAANHSGQFSASCSVCLKLLLPTAKRAQPPNRIPLFRIVPTAPKTGTNDSKTLRDGTFQQPEWPSSCLSRAEVKLSRQPENPTAPAMCPPLYF